MNSRNVARIGLMVLYLLALSACGSSTPQSSGQEPPGAAQAQTGQQSCFEDKAEAIVANGNIIKVTIEPANPETLDALKNALVEFKGRFSRPEATAIVPFQGKNYTVSKRPNYGGGSGQDVYTIGLCNY